MTLSGRLMVVISSILVVVVTIGAVAFGQRARAAIRAELYSSVHLTSQLLELALTTAGSTSPDVLLEKLRSSLGALSATRHLQVELVADGTRIIPADPADMGSVDGVPGWFARLVHPAQVELRRRLSVPGLPDADVLITANPAAEIAEAWADYKSLLLIMLAFFAVVAAFIYRLIDRSLAPVHAILDGLDKLEHGDYGVRLPAYRLPEFQAIAQKINHLTLTLYQSREQNRLLRQHSLAIQEQERRHLARELHDEMGQSVSALKALAIAIGQRSTDPQINAAAATIADTSTRLYGVVRGMMQDLRPPALDELGLQTALQSMIDDWQLHHVGTVCAFECDMNLPPLEETVSISLYRIVQECLTNIAKHAAASRAEVRLHCRADDTDDRDPVLQLRVTDNGIGLSASRGGGFGISGMRERVVALEGRFHIDSPATGGVSVDIELPLPNNLDRENRAYEDH